MDAALRARERACRLAPDDPQAAAALRKEMSRTGVCPTCMVVRQPMGRPSMPRPDDDGQRCWPCWLDRAVATLVDLTLGEVQAATGATERRCSSGLPWERCVARSVAAAVRRTLRGRWPSVCGGFEPQPPGPCRVRGGMAYGRDGSWRNVAVVSHRGSDGLVVVGMASGASMAGAMDEWVHDFWPDLAAKPVVVDGMYVVSNGRPVHEKNLRQRLRGWADRPGRIGPTARESRIKAPKEAWAAWDRARTLRIRAAEAAASPPTTGSTAGSPPSPPPST